MRVQKVQKVHRVQRGRWTAAARLKGLCPLGKGCVRSRSGGDSASGAEGCGIALWTMNIYAAKGGSKNFTTAPNGQSIKRTFLVFARPSAAAR